MTVLQTVALPLGYEAARLKPQVPNAIGRTGDVSTRAHDRHFIGSAVTAT